LVGDVGERGFYGKMLYFFSRCLDFLSTVSCFIRLFSCVRRSIFVDLICYFGGSVVRRTEFRVVCEVEVLWCVVAVMQQGDGASESFLTVVFGDV